MRIEIAVLSVLAQIGLPGDFVRHCDPPDGGAPQGADAGASAGAAYPMDAGADAPSPDGGGLDGAMDAQPGADAGDTDAARADDAGTGDVGAADAGEAIDGFPGGVCGCLAPVEQMPPSGYLVRFRDGNEHAHVWVTSAAGVTRIEQFLSGQIPALGVPGGPIELTGEFNPGYRYRMIPDKIHFGEFWVDVCDAPPCYVEQNAAAWAVSIRTWCPWGFREEAIWDCRAGASGGACPLIYSPQTSVLGVSSIPR